MTSVRVQQTESRDELNTNEDGSEESVEEIGICRPHVLCTTCRRLFSEEKVRSWVQGKAPTFEDFKVPFHASLKDLEDSVGQKCHVCTLVWEELNNHRFFRQEHLQSTSMIFRMEPRSPSLHSQYFFCFDSNPTPEAREFAPITFSRNQKN
jgi:hypothetical protein